MSEEAGGGVSEGHESPIRNFSPKIKEHVGALYNELFKEQGDARSIFANVQGATESEYLGFLDSQGGATVDSFLTYLASPHATLLIPEDTEDLSHPLSHYFISSSHNTYLTGNQLSSEASAEGYRNVLLRGCRCVEIDVWDGKPPEEPGSGSGDEPGPPKRKQSLRKRFRDGLKLGRRKPIKKEMPQIKENLAPKESETLPEPWSATKKAEPRVLHGYTLTKEVSFREVCEAIRETAFVTSDLPVIVSLEVHTSLEQQEVMVDIIKRVWRGYLVQPLDSETSKTSPLPSPKDLKRKILIKVKYTPPEKVVEEEEAEEKGLERLPSTSSSSTEDEMQQVVTKDDKPKKKKKMLNDLSQLGVYTRAHHFKSWDQPEAKEPTHVFSLSEGAVAEALQSQSAVLFKHNKHFLMRTYPKGSRISSSNLTPTIFWRQGIQIVALNWQKWDKGTMINEAMFAGTGGWVLKPALYRSADTPAPKRVESNSAASLHPDMAHSKPAAATTPEHAHRSKQILNLTIEFLAGQDLPLPPGEESERSFCPYVKVSLHAETLSAAQPQSTLRRSLSRSRSLRRAGSRKYRSVGADKSVDRSAQDQAAPNTSKPPSTVESNGSGLNPSALQQRTDTSRFRNADFARQRLDFSGVPIDDPSLCFVRFKVEDDVQFQRDPMAAWTCVRLDRMRPGLRVIRLFDANGMPCDGFLLVRVEMTLQDVMDEGEFSEKPAP